MSVTAIRADETNAVAQSLCVESGSIITNVAQVAAAFDQPGLSYPVIWPYELQGMFEGQQIWFADFDQLPQEFGALRGSTGYVLHGVTFSGLTLVLDAVTGVLTGKDPFSDTVLFQFDPPADYQPFQRYDEELQRWFLDSGMAPMTYAELIRDNRYSFLDPPQLVLEVWVGSIADCALYESNLAADQAEAEMECEAPAEPLTAAPTAGLTHDSLRGGEMMSMDAGACTITDEAQAFRILSIAPEADGSMTIVFESCSDHVYGVYSAEEMSYTNVWTLQQWMWGADGTTSWTDTNAPAFPARFYRVVRANPTNSNNGIPFGWAVDNGLDPLDPNLASETNANPWAHGLTNLQVYQNPSVLIADNYSTLRDGIPDWWKVTYGFSLTDPNVAGGDPDGDGLPNVMEYLLGTDPLVLDPPMGLWVNGGNPYTSSLTIPIQALTTNYPKVRVSADPLMNNATVETFSSGMVSYALLDNGDGLYNLFLQYADAAGYPQGLVVSASVTLDRLAPTVDILSPPASTVLDQAFITLQAVAADPDPVEATATRPLKIWINDVPFWNRNGTNIVVNRFPVPSGTNSFTVTIRAADEAGNTNVAARTWMVDPSGDTVAPLLSSFNIASSTLLPDVSAVWVEGAVDDGNALVTAVVSSDGGDVTTNSLNVRNLRFEGSVPLESGTNRVAFTASDAAGNATSNLFTIVRSNRYRFEITSPAFGAFASAPSNYVSGYVSALFDEGLPTETNVTSVLINGVAAVLDTNVDANGNLSFTATNAIGLGVPITGFIAGLGIPTDPPPDPPAMSQEYEVTAKTKVDDVVYCNTELCGASRPSYPCGYGWFVMVANDVLSNEFVLSGGDASVLVNGYRKSRRTPSPYYRCSDNPANDPSIWGSWSAFEYLDSYQDADSRRSLSFGSLPRSWHNGDRSLYVHGDTGWEEWWPWENKTSASLTFTAPRQYDTNTTVIFTFEGMDYQRPDGVPLDLSAVKYQGQSPVAWSNEIQSVCYLITMDGGRPYTISQDSFQWPSFTTNSIQQHTYATSYFSDTLHHLSWTNFHNLSVRIEGPTNVLCLCSQQQQTNILLTAHAVSSGQPYTTGSYDWSVIAGSDRVQMDATTSSNMVKITPKAPSQQDGDVQVTMTFTLANISMTVTQKLTVLTPWGVHLDSQAPGDLPSGSGYTNSCVYQVVNQLPDHGPLRAGGLSVHEDFPVPAPPVCGQVTGDYPTDVNGRVTDLFRIAGECLSALDFDMTQRITVDCVTNCHVIHCRERKGIDVEDFGPCQ